MDSAAVFAIIGLITTIGMYVLIPTVNSSNNTITTGGGNRTRRVGRGNCKTRK
jgi:hypothetical protein